MPIFGFLRSRGPRCCPWLGALGTCLVLLGAAPACQKWRSATDPGPLIGLPAPVSPSRLIKAAGSASARVARRGWVAPQALRWGIHLACPQRRIARPGDCWVRWVRVCLLSRDNPAIMAETTPTRPWNRGRPAARERRHSLGVPVQFGIPTAPASSHPLSSAHPPGWRRTCPPSSPPFPLTLSAQCLAHFDLAIPPRTQCSPADGWPAGPAASPMSNGPP